jgi:membrane-associated phospholipid phosphatase
VSVAQYNAVIAAEDAKARGVHPSEAGAAAAAAAAVLEGLYGASERPLLLSWLAEDAAYFPTLPSERDADWARGMEVGRQVAAAVLAYAATDRTSVPWDGGRLTGPTYWTPVSLPPSDAMFGGARPWLMSSGSQFRPAPPPPVGSAAYLADLAEVRTISDTRTPEQVRVAQYWAVDYGAGGPAGFFGTLAAGYATRQHMDERRAARVLAVTQMAIMDAAIGCYDAKYVFWYPRPYQMDAAITIPPRVARPNFPAYPSAHSCLSSAAAGVLSAYFPREAGALQAMVAEAGVSRIYAGLHFRFDVTAGQQLGASVAALALRLAPDGHQPIPLD